MKQLGVMRLSKTLAKGLIIGLCITGTAYSSAQDGAGATLLKEALTAKHIVKTNLVGLAMYSVNANYETKTGVNTSVGLLAGYRLSNPITVDALGELDGDEMTYKGEIDPKGLFINPYFRMYPSGAMTGFYVEAFARYYDFTYLVPYDYTKEGKDISANLDGTASAIGGGLAIGGQFSLGQRVFLDINTGFGFAKGDIHLETNDPNLDAEDYADIKRNIEENRDDADIKIFLLGDIITNIEADADENSAWADIENQLFPVFRGGISIGYAF
jgi:hypothetical protein